MNGYDYLPWVVVLLVVLFCAWQQLRFQREADQRRQAEVTLRSAETMLQRMHQAIESASDAIGIGDSEGTSVYHNRAHAALFGYSVEELNAVPGSGVLLADANQAQEIFGCLRQGRSWSGEADVKTKAGRRIPAFVRADIIRDEAGHPVGILGVVTDITERRRMLSTLDAERQRLAVTLQSIAEGVITTDAAGRVERLNSVAEQLTGWQQAEAVGQPLSLIFPLLDEATREPRVTSLGYEADATPQQQGRILQTRNGRERLIATNAAGLSASGGDEQGLVIVFRDVTQERRDTEERERAKRLEALGLLAGGIAHDFANLLTAMIGHLTLVQAVQGLPSKVEFRLTEVERTAWRARDLTQQLLTFARGGSLDKKSVALGEVIRDSVALSLLVAPGVSITVDVPDDLWTVQADAGQLGQLIANLALNGVQAMGEQGELQIVARNLAPGARAAYLSASAIVHIQVTDTGCGIPAENLSKIFDPFFTTKKKGTGLGLATVYSIVKKHRGEIQVESAIGVGTTFQVYLPAEFVPAEGVDARLIG